MLFLILFLFYSAYFMLRFSLEPGPARANISAVYALFGVVLIPVSFLAIRLAENFIHPVVFTRDVPQCPTRCSSRSASAIAGMLALAGALYRNELLGKRLDARLRELREAAGVSTGEKYSSAAYAVVLAAPCSPTSLIIALKLAAASSASSARARATLRASAGSAEAPEEARWLSSSFWPALLAYGEAAVALGGEARRPGLRGAARDLGRPARLARADGAARRAGGAGRRLPVVDAGPARSTCSPGSSSAAT